MHYYYMLIDRNSVAVMGGWEEGNPMPIVGILSNLLLAAAPEEVLDYKLQSVLQSVFLLSPGLALLPIPLKGFLASRGVGRNKNQERGAAKSELKYLQSSQSYMSHAALSESPTN